MFYLLDEHELAVTRNRLYGVYPAEVTDIVDPDGQGRVKIRLPWSPDNGNGLYEVWARLAVPLAGNNRGTWLIPDPGDEVLVCFEAGDPRRPYVVGSLWNGQDTPPETMDQAGNNFLKVIRSRNGVRVILDDSDGQETLILETPGGQRITLQDGPGSIEVRDSNGNTITLDAAGVTVQTGSQVKVQATTVEVSAAMVTINAAMSKFSGVVQADTVISNSVISATYSPGAGNIW